MVTLLVVAAGFMIVIGKKDIAERLVHVLVGLVIVLSFTPGLIERTDRDPASLGCRQLDAGSDFALNLVLIVTLAGVGATLWRLRSTLAKRREEEARKWSAPRERATPQAPPRDEDIDRSEQP